MLSARDITTDNATININGTVYTVKKETVDGKDTYSASAGTGTVYSLDELAAKVADGTSITSKDIQGAENTLIVRDYTKTTNIGKEEAESLIQAALLQANNIGVNKAGGGEYAAVDDIDDTKDSEVKFTINKGTAVYANDLSFTLHVGADADMSNKIDVSIESMSSAGLGIEGLNVSDDTGMAATYAIDAIADAIQKVSDQRSALGAVQNRLEHTISNLDNVVENTTSAESRIRDTDMAEEMVEYSKNNILAQAGQSMLAQANQSTQGVMSLLQ